jgi:hypothetical protein
MAMPRVWIIALCLVSGAFCLPLFAADSATTQGDSPVVVRYPKGVTELVPISEGMKFFTNRGYPLRSVPDELIGLTLARRPAGEKPYDIKIDAASGATIYLLMEGDDNAPGLAEIHSSLADANWTRLPEQAFFGPADRKSLLAIYKKDFAGEEEFTLHSAGFAGVTLAAAKITVKLKADQNPELDATIGVIFGQAGSATHLAGLDASVRVLEVSQREGDSPAAADCVYSLSASHSDHGGPNYFYFAMPVDEQVRAALDTSLRALGNQYTGFDVGDVRITLDGGLAEHEDPASGLAFSVLLHSMIEGFQIDPATAIAGIVGTDAKISPVTDLSGRLHAAKADCKIIIVPEANYDELVDFKIYYGLPAVLGVQVLGVSTIDDAIACARDDRGDTLKHGIELGEELCKKVHDTPGYLQTDDAADLLHEAAEDAPGDLTLRLLLQQAEGKTRRRLSPEASECCTLTAVKDFLPDFFNADAGAATQPTTRMSGENETALLRKVRPLADLKVQPLIDAWSEFLLWQTAYNSGRAALAPYLEHRKALMDAMAGLKLNKDAASDLVRQGI